MTTEYGERLLLLASEVACALARIDAGRYGECESCHGEIGSTRLGLEPTARFCKRCSVKRAAADSPFEDFPLKTMH